MNNSFCHNVFKTCLMQRFQTASVCGKRLTISLIRQFCSRRLRTYFVKIQKISIIEWITYDEKWKTLCQKEKLLVLSNFFFCHYVFKKSSAAEVSKSVYMRERVNGDIDSEVEKNLVILYMNPRRAYQPLRFSNTSMSN